MKSTDRKQEKAAVQSSGRNRESVERLKFLISLPKVKKQEARNAKKVS